MSDFKAPDLSAPRYRAKTTNILKRQLYKEFIEKYPRYAEIGLEMFKEIVTTFNGMLWNGVVDNRDGVELPESLGYLFIGSCPKTKRTNPDYQRSIEYGQVINHRNMASDNFLCKIFYTNYSLKYKFRDRELWGFVSNKVFRQTVSKGYRDNYTKYVVVDSTIKISEMFRKAVAIHEMNDRYSKPMEGYDEFKLD